MLTGSPITWQKNEDSFTQRTVESNIHIPDVSKEPRTSLLAEFDRHDERLRLVWLAIVFGQRWVDVKGCLQDFSTLLHGVL